MILKNNLNKTIFITGNLLFGKLKILTNVLKKETIEKFSFLI